MVNCVVPFCSSDDRKEKLSFHEFPCNLALRLKWIVAISRKGEHEESYWVPQENSRVCEKHFLKEDYKANAKIKALKPGVVPSIFPSDPKSMQKKIIEQRNRRKINVKENVNNNIKRNVNVKSRNGINDIIKHQVNDNGKHNVNNITKSKVNAKDTSDLNNINDKKCDKKLNAKVIITKFNLINSNLKLDTIKRKETDNIKLKVSDDISEQSYPSSSTVSTWHPKKKETDNVELKVNDDISEQNLPSSSAVSTLNPLTCSALIRKPIPVIEERKTSNLNYEELERRKSFAEYKLANLRQKYKNTAACLSKTKRKLSLFKSKYLNLKNLYDASQQKLLDYNIDQVEYFAENGNIASKFILDQLVSFKKRRPTYSDITIRSSILLHKKFPSCYQYIQDIGLLKLPAERTLGKHAAKSGSSKLVKERLSFEEQVSVPNEPLNTEEVIYYAEEPSEGNICDDENMSKE